MAPSTALLMLLLSLAAALRARASPPRAARRVETVCTLLVLAGGVAFWINLLFGFAWPPGGAGGPPTETVGEIPVGRMSPVTAGCFLAVAAALLCGRVAVSRWALLRSLGGWLGLGVLALSGIILAGYGVGSPFLYGGGTIPMALLTAVSFVLVSAATLLGAGRDAWPVRMFLRAHAPAEREAGHRVEWSLLVLLLVLAAGITLVGLRYLNHQQADARAAAWAQLEAIADLKVQQIVHWRKERLKDANLVRATPYATRRALDALAQPESSLTRRMFTAWLAPLMAGATYEQVFLLDAGLQVRLVHPDGPAPVLAEAVRRAATEALRTRQVVASDLHRATDEAHIHLDFVVPLIVRREGTNDNVPAAGLGSSPADRAAGVLVLQVNARDFLYPLIEPWPTPSPSAETLLVRREGQEVVFLNDLRHRKGTALTLRRPLEDPHLPAAMGARGQRGVREGVDYRGVRVVAAVRAVPDTGWVMVAKVDEAELYAPLRQQALSVGAVTVALLTAVALGVTVLWRRRNEHFLHAQLAAERAGRASAERFEHLMKNASDAILLADEQDTILEANDRALALYGYSLAELQTRTLPQLTSTELRRDFWGQEGSLPASGPAVRETLHRRKDGSLLPVEVSGRLVEIAGRRYHLGIIRDITQRQQADYALRQQAEELRSRNRELTRFNRASVGRELRMIELKTQINDLRRQLGLPPRYPLAFGPEPQPPGETAPSPGNPPPQP